MKTKSASSLAAISFNSESVPILVITLVSVAGAVAVEFVPVLLPPAGVGDAASAAKARADVCDDAPPFLIIARATSTPAAAITITPSTQRVLPGVPVAWQLHPGSQAAACCFSNSILSACFRSSFGKFMVRCSLCFLFVFYHSGPLPPANPWSHSRHRLLCPRPLCRRNTDRKPPPDG